MRQAAAYFTLRLAVGLLALLPAAVVRSLGQAAGRVWHTCAPGRRRLAVRHMERAGAADPDRAAREVFSSYGRYFAETFWLRPRRLASIWGRMEVDGRHRLEQARDQGEGAILALPHLGNWEVAALVASEVGIPLVAVAERLANARITEWFTAQRTMLGIEVVLTGSGSSGRRSLVEALRAGKAVALLCDRDLSGRGVKVDFFGEETTLPAGPAVLSLRTGAPILPVGAYFTARGYRAVIHPPIEYDPATAEVADVTQLLADALETVVRADPSQWHLVQPNWPSDRE